MVRYSEAGCVSPGDPVSVQRARCWVCLESPPARGVGHWPRRRARRLPVQSLVLGVGTPRRHYTRESTDCCARVSRLFVHHKDTGNCRVGLHRRTCTELVSRIYNAPPRAVHFYESRRGPFASLKFIAPPTEWIRRSTGRCEGRPLSPRCP